MYHVMAYIPEDNYYPPSKWGNDAPMSCYAPHAEDRPATIIANKIEFIQESLTKIMM
jgi:hypothetical protein